MRTRHLCSIAAALCGMLVVTSNASAQRGPPARGDAPAPFYDTTTVRTFTGTIERIDTVTGPGTPAGGIHLQLRTGSATIPVHVGPTWYLETHPLTLVRGDRVTVRGSRVTIGGQPAVLAAEITRDRDRATLRLRDARGLPAWNRIRPPAGRGRRVP